MVEKTLWGIHAGATGDADSLFRDGGLIALGWPATGDLGVLKAARETFKARLLATYPQTKAGAVPTVAGMLFRFAKEIKIGDLVAYPSKKDRTISLGHVVGPYTYLHAAAGGYVHQRKVEWVKSLKRTEFSQGALYEIGSALSFFQIKNFAGEFFSAIEGKQAQVLDPDADPTTDAVASQVSETTEDFIVKTLAKELKGLGFEDFVQHLLERMDFRVRRARVNQPGYDLIASRDSLGFEPPIVKVQVKSTEATLGDPEVSQLYGKLSHGEFALFVTLGTVTSKARDFEASKYNLRIIDGSELVRLIFEHYEGFDSRYKGLLPLRRVYVPAPTSHQD